MTLIAPEARDLQKWTLADLESELQESPLK
jgi:hypothetical protein